MKNSLKLMAVGLVAACCLLPQITQAQTMVQVIDDYNVVSVGGLAGASTNVILAASTNICKAGNTNGSIEVLNVTKWEEVWVFFSASGGPTNIGGTITVTPKVSGISGTNAVAKPAFTVTMAGTTPAQWATNLYIGSAGYLTFTVANSDSANGGLTNVFLQVATKPYRHGR